VAIAREIVARATREYAGPPVEAVRRHLDEEMRLAAAELTDEERDILGAFDESGEETQTARAIAKRVNEDEVSRGTKGEEEGEGNIQTWRRVVTTERVEPAKGGR
jgi:hypothetical protein